MTFMGGRSSFATAAEMASDDRRPLRAPPGTPPLYKSRSLSPGGANRYYSRSATETREGYAHQGLPSEDHPVRTRTASPPATPKESHARRDDQLPQTPPRARHRSSSVSSSPSRHNGVKPSTHHQRSSCESPPMLEMSGSASTASLSPVPPQRGDSGIRSEDANKSREDAATSATTSASLSPTPHQQVGRRSVSPRTVSPRGSNVSRIIAALETVIPASQAETSGGAAANGKTSPVTTKVAASSGSDKEGLANDEYAASRGEATSPIEIGSTPHPSTVLRTVEPKRAAHAASDATSTSGGGLKMMEAPGYSVGESNLASLTTLSSASSWRRPPPSPRAASSCKPRLAEPRYSPHGDSPMLLETIDLPPEEDGLYGGSFIPLSNSSGISSHPHVASPPRDVPDFGNISAISHDDASGESPVRVQVHRTKLEVTETTDAGKGEEEEEDRDVPTELVKSRSIRTSATVLSEACSDPSTTTEVTSNVTASGSHNLPAPTSPRFSRSAIMAQRSKISSRRISKSSGGKSKRSNSAGPTAAAAAAAPSADRRRTPRRGSSSPPKPTSTPLAASPRSKPRSTSTGRRARYGGSAGPRSESEEESIDSRATQETLDPMLVQYFLDLVLAEEGIVDGAHVEAGTVPTSDSKDATDTDSWGGRSEADPRMSDAEARSYAKAMLDDHFGAEVKREGSARSPASVIVDFWKSFACDNLWQSSDNKEEEKRPSSGTRSELPGEESSAFAAFDATFFQELWKELQSYRESCGSLSNVQDLKAYVTQSRSETPATMATTMTDASRGPSSLGKKYARSDIMSFCVPKDPSIGSKERSDLILQRCKQRFPLLYDKLVQRLEDERAKRKLGLLRRHDEQTDSAFSTCTEEYTSGQDYSVESVDTSDNGNDTPRTANRGTVTGAFLSVPVGFGVLRAPVALKDRGSLPPRSAPSRQGRGAVEQDSEPTRGVGFVSEAAPTPPEISPDQDVDTLNHEAAGRGASEQDLRPSLPDTTWDQKASQIAKGQVQPSEAVEAPGSENHASECIPGTCNPLEPILEAQGLDSVHPPDVVVRRSSATCKSDDGFNDSDSFGVHSNLTEEKKWAEGANNRKQPEATRVKSKKSDSQSRSVILTDLAEALGADRFDAPCDDNDKSTASGKDILADLARMTDPVTIREYSKVVRRSSRSRSGSRERATNDTATPESVQPSEKSPSTWEVFEATEGFDAPVKPRALFRDERNGEQEDWEDFTTGFKVTTVVWPKNESAAGIMASLRSKSSSRCQGPPTSAVAETLKTSAVEPKVPLEQDSQEADREAKTEPFVKSSQRFSIVGRIRSSSVSKSKPTAASNSPSPRKGWLRRRSKARTQADEFDQTEWRSFDSSRFDCDASLATLDDAPTAALLQSKGSPTSVMGNSQRSKFVHP